MFTKEEIALAKPTVEAIKKISKGKRYWKPEVGQWVIYNNNACLVTRAHADLIWWIELDCGRTIEAKNVTPLLHWERIEETLEGMGYDLHIKDDWVDIERTEKIYGCHISKGYKNGMLNVLVSDECETGYEAKTRQEAVMLAVIELGKESQDEPT